MKRKLKEILFIGAWTICLGGGAIYLGMMSNENPRIDKFIVYSFFGFKCLLFIIMNILLFLKFYSMGLFKREPPDLSIYEIQMSKALNFLLYSLSFVLFLGIGGFFPVKHFLDLKKRDTLTFSGVATPAKITKLDRESKSTSYGAWIEYIGPQKTILRTKIVLTPFAYLELKERHTLGVHYDPNAPDQVFADDYPSDFDLVSLLLSLLGLQLTLGTLLYLIQYKRRRLVQ